MAAISDQKRRFGSTASSLLVAYLLVLQGVMVAISGLGAATGPMAGGLLCAAQGAAAPSSDEAPQAPCCVLHCAGAAAPPPALAGLAPPAMVVAQAAFPGDASARRAPRQLLPVGSRAPPQLLV
jgi:hypothetical protein